MTAGGDLLVYAADLAARLPDAEARELAAICFVLAGLPDVAAVMRGGSAAGGEQSLGTAEGILRNHDAGV